MSKRHYCFSVAIQRVLEETLLPNGKTSIISDFHHRAIYLSGNAEFTMEEAEAVAIGTFYGLPEVKEKMKDGKWFHTVNGTEITSMCNNPLPAV